VPTYVYECRDCKNVSNIRCRYYSSSAEIDPNLKTTSVKCPKCHSKNLRRLPTFVNTSAGDREAEGLTRNSALDVKESSLQEPIKVEWMDNEPTDPTDQVTNLCTARFVGQNGWSILAASRRGRLHAHNGEYREDAFAFRVTQGWNLIAVADGAGSASLARVGANIATKAAVEHLAIGLAGEESKNEPVPDAENILRHLQEAMLTAKKRLHVEAKKRRLEPREFATTLLILVHRPSVTGDFIGTAQIGDGLIVGWDHLDKPILLASPEHGEFAGETQFITHISGPEQFESRIKIIDPMPQDLRYILLMTDGVADDFYPFAGNLVKLVEHFPNILSLDNADRIDKLVDLIGYEKRGSADDRTLVILAPHIDHQSN